MTVVDVSAATDTHAGADTGPGVDANSGADSGTDAGVDSVVNSDAASGASVDSSDVIGTPNTVETTSERVFVGDNRRNARTVELCSSHVQESDGPNDVVTIVGEGDRVELIITKF